MYNMKFMCFLYEFMKFHMKFVQAYEAHYIYDTNNCSLEADASLI